MNEVSVVIPNLNGMKYLQVCLDSLRAQTTRDFEVIMVDNGSEDESVAFVRESYPEVRLIELDRNYGFCRAVNIGIKAAATPYVILLNNDIEAERRFVANMLSGIKRYPDCFSASAKMLQMYQRDKIDNGGDYYCALGWAFTMGKDRGADTCTAERKIFAACAGAAIYRTEVFKEIGYFDEKHFAYLEDIDIGYRARIFGYRNCYLPEAIVYHAGSGTSGSRYNEFKIRYSSRNNVYLIYKNMPLLQIVLNSPFLLIGFIVKMCFFIRQGHGLVYLKGLLKGFEMARQGQKVKFRSGHLKNYLRIQLELWLNILRRAAGG